VPPHGDRNPARHAVFTAAMFWAWCVPSPEARGLAPVILGVEQRLETVAPPPPRRLDDCAFSQVWPPRDGSGGVYGSVAGAETGVEQGA
jgi:hypothetical protein